MNRVALFLVLFCLLPAQLVLSGPQDDRRIEEEKRKELLSTQPQIQHQSPSKAQTQKSQPLSDEDVAYLAGLSLRKVTYGYDLCKTLVLLLKTETQYVGLDAQVAFLKEKDFLPEDLKDSFDPMQPLRRGVLAYALRRALNIKGGVFLRLFGESQRYAVKELTYEGIMSEGHPNGIVSGEELAPVINRAVNYLGG